MTCIVDKHGQQQDLRGAVLELGCGPKKLASDSIGVDIEDSPGVDIVGDAKEILDSLPSGLVTGR
jgi:hypothetical protein